MVPARLGVYSPFNLDSELLPSLSAAAIFPLGRTTMDLVDPSESESIKLNSSSGSRLTNVLVGFPLLGSEDLIRLGDDLLHVLPIYHKPYKKDTRLISSISDVISKGKASPTGLSSADATVLAETFHKVPPPPRQIPLSI